MAAPSVYAAIHAVSAELAQSGIAKPHTNAIDDYKYRSIDDLLDKLAPLLAKHRLCILPRTLEREAAERHDEADRSLFHVALRVAFELTSVDDGSRHIVEAFGEALDPSDKATAKAMSAAYKSAMVQTFCIRCTGAEECEKSSYRVTNQISEPLQGWSQWAADIEDILSLCESKEAVTLVQERNRDFLAGLGRERPDLYQQVGKAFSTRLSSLPTAAAQNAAPNDARATPTKTKGKLDLKEEEMSA